MHDLREVNMTPFWSSHNGETRLTLYCGDALEVLRELPPVDVIITDPVWPNTRVPLTGAGRSTELFAEVAQHFPRLAQRVVVHLGCDSDPRFLAGMPDALPFFRVCWLRRVPPTFKGNLLYSGDVAYVFGGPFSPQPGRRVIPGETDAVSKGERDRGNDHPCPRNLQHVRWLVAQFSRPGETILDPFAGSGTTLVAAATLGRSAVGVEIDEGFCGLARRRCGAALRRPPLLTEAVALSAPATEEESR